MTAEIASAVARVFLARWYERTAPPPPCPDRSLHTDHTNGCSTCLCSSAMARDFQQYERAGGCCRNVSTVGFQACGNPVATRYMHDGDVCGYCIEHDYPCGKPLRPATR